jgi:hypothetical protein
VVSFTPRTLYPQGKNPGTHWIRGWVGPRAGPDTVVKRKIPSPCRDSDPRLWSPESSTVPLSYPGSCTPPIIKFNRNPFIVSEIKQADDWTERVTCTYKHRNMPSTLCVHIMHFVCFHLLDFWQMGYALNQSRWFDMLRTVLTHTIETNINCLLRSLPQTRPHLHTLFLRDPF